MAIQLRRGNYNDFDPTRMMSGEIAVCLDNGYVFVTLSPGNAVQLGTAETLEEALRQAAEYVSQAQTAATTSLNRSRDAEAWARGTRNGVIVPSSDQTYHNNAMYYASLAANAVSFTESTDASATKIGYQAIIVNGTTHIIPGTIYMQQTIVLEENIVTPITFTNNVITTNSSIDVWSNFYGLSPVDIVTETGRCTLTFVYSETVSLTCRIYIR